MNKDKILELLAEAVDKNVNEIRNINENTNLTEIGFDSIRFIRFIVNMETEFEMLKIFELVDNYSVSADGKFLSLNRARMAPLARFEVEYLD